MRSGAECKQMRNGFGTDSGVVRSRKDDGYGNPVCTAR